MRCNKHPDHTLHPGICSSCLREKLSSIPSSYCSSSSRNRTIRVRACSSSPSCLSSASSSLCASPARKGVSHAGAEYGSSGLRKSRSLIGFASRKTRGAAKMTIKNRNKKKDGFWSKLMGNSSSTGRNNGGQGGEIVMHSRTSVKDRF